MGLGDLIRRRRRRLILEKKPLSDDHWTAAFAREPLVRGMSAAEESALREIATILAAEKEFHFTRESDDSTHARLAVCIQAAVPILGLGIDWYRGWHSFILVPDGYSLTQHSPVGDGEAVYEWEEEVSGEILPLGPVVLSLTDVFSSAGDYQVVVHEMAHKLDLLTGTLDGAPPLSAEMKPAWETEFGRAYRELRGEPEPTRAAGADSPRRGGTDRGSEPESLGTRDRTRGHGKKPGRGARRPSLDPYAAEAPEEFFAVATETFFGAPLSLRRRLPEIYELLRRFYRQDPAERV